MDICRLPEETQLLILSLLDGSSLVRTQRVCHLWRHLVKELETNKQIWLTCCLREIPLDILIDLTGLSELTARRKSGVYAKCCFLLWQYWKSVYAEFYRSRYVCSVDVKETELHFFKNHGAVTLLRLEENTLYSGHEDGSILCWKNFDHELECFAVAKHFRPVTGIATMSMKTTVESILNSLNTPLIVSVSFDRSIILSNPITATSVLYHHHSKSVNDVCAWDGRFITAGNDSISHGQPIWAVSDSQKCAARKAGVLEGHAIDRTTAVTCWDNVVLSGDNQGNLIRWRLQEKDDSGCHQISFIANLNEPVKTIIMRGQVILCLTVDGNIHLSYNGGENFYTFNMFAEIQKVPQYIALRGTLLAIGTRAGFVYIYHLACLASWRTFNPSKPARIVKTNSEHITGLDIGDDGKGPVIVIGNEKRFIYMFRWHIKH